MSAKTEVLNAILKADKGLLSSEVAAKAEVKRKTARDYLRSLYQEGLIERIKMNNQSYIYFPKEGAEGKVSRLLAEDTKPIKFPGDDMVDAAIRAARPHWKKSQLLQEVTWCARCNRHLVFEPWHQDWLRCPQCGWNVRRSP